MKTLIIVLLWIAVIIMILSICSFLKSKKIIQDTLKEGNVGIPGLLNGYLLLLIFFTLAYILYLVNWQRTVTDENMDLLVPSILFFGSIFVYITMFLLKILLKNLLTVKMNQLDSLTGVLNKDAVKRSVDKLFQTTDCKHALLLLDLDNFKDVNDLYGHMEGDKIIQGVACTLRNTLCAEDIVGRFGGDEFVVLLKDTTNAKALEVANLLSLQIHEFCKNTLPDLHLSASIGIAYRQENDSYDEMFKRADSAMYKSKQSGKDCISEEHCL